MRTIDQMIQAEVLVCVSSLVSDLASGYGAFRATHNHQSGLHCLIEQAFELASPVADYEEAAIQAGWQQNSDGLWAHKSDGDPETSAYVNDSAQEICEANGLEPYDREVFEHWAVTDWFADKLIAAGEKVDKDFAGMCVWARTTTGQGISQDYVVQTIHAALVRS